MSPGSSSGPEICDRISLLSQFSHSPAFFTRHFCHTLIMFSSLQICGKFNEPNTFPWAEGPGLLRGSERGRGGGGGLAPWAEAGPPC